MMAGFRGYALVVSTALLAGWPHASTAQQVQSCTGEACPFTGLSVLTVQDRRPMRFGFHDYGTSRWITANGEITKGTADRFESFLAAINVRKGDEVALNSPGGNLAEALAMGRLIRKHLLDTVIARVEAITVADSRAMMGISLERPPPSRTRFAKAWEMGSFILKHPLYDAETAIQRKRDQAVSPLRELPDTVVGVGECDSSCNFVFMGGVVRDSHVFPFRDINGRFGVHRFQFSVEAPGNQSEAAQITLADLVRYLQEMDVDPSFLTFMAQFHDVTYLPQSILETLKIVNHWDITEWQLFLRGGAFVLEATIGSPPDVRHRIDLVCEPGPGGDRSRLVARIALAEREKVLGLLLSEMPIRLKDYWEEIELHHRWVLSSKGFSLPNVPVTPLNFLPAKAFTVDIDSREMVDPIKREQNSNRLTAAFLMTPRIVKLFKSAGKISIIFGPGMGEEKTRIDQFVGLLDIGELVLAKVTQRVDVAGVNLENSKKVREFIDACH